MPKELLQVKRADGIYKVGDTVLIRPTTDTLPYIAEITKITQKSNGVQLMVQWFYRPEEALGGRKTFHGDREVYRSDHKDPADLDTVIEKCSILDVQQYRDLPKEERKKHFFSRFTYLAAKKEFKPDKITVHCICGMPENPDLDMIPCSTCHAWYHAVCVHIDGLNSNLAGLKWNCSQCSANKAANL